MKYLKPILEEHLDDNTLFIDAFCGGANVISEIDHPYKIGIEFNKYVCALWQKLKYDGMFGIPNKLTQEEYEDIKQSYLNNDGKYPDWLIGYVGSALSWGGAWFNGYPHYNERKKEDHIMEAYNGLQNHLGHFRHMDTTVFVWQSYDDLELNRKAVIYCDPPYASTISHTKSISTTV